MFEYSQEDITKAIQILFSEQDHAEVLSLLDEYGKEDYEREKYRVQMGVLKLSEGSIDKLLDNIKLAKTDYRDVLLSAEYEPDGKNFKEIKDPYGHMR